MAAKTELLLVDGVGRPRLIEVPAHEPWPPRLGMARDGQKTGPGRLVSFVCTGEIDPDDRMIYRQEGTNARIRTEYLTVSPIPSVPFNQARLE